MSFERISHAPNSYFGSGGKDLIHSDIFLRVVAGTEPSNKIVRRLWKQLLPRQRGAFPNEYNRAKI